MTRRTASRLRDKPIISSEVVGSRALAAGRYDSSARHWKDVLREDWFDVLVSIAARVNRDNVLILTAGVAFYVFVAIPSGLAAVVAIYGLVFNPADVQHQAVWLVGLLPADVIQILTNFLAMLAARQPSTLGVRMLMGLLIALWSAQSASSSMITALNAVYEKTETRGFLQFQLASFVLALCSIIFATLSLLLFASVPPVLAHFPLAAGARWAISIFRWPALVVLAALAISGIYRFAPSDGGSQNWGLWGVALTTVVWVGSSVLFGLYVAKVASYDATYGSLGTVVVLLLWLYIAVLVVLLGAEFNAELGKRVGSGFHPVLR